MKCGETSPGELGPGGFTLQELGRGWGAGMTRRRSEDAVALRASAPQGRPVGLPCLETLQQDTHPLWLRPLALLGPGQPAAESSSLKNPPHRPPCIPARVMLRAFPASVFRLSASRYPMHRLQGGVLLL